MEWPSLYTFTIYCGSSIYVPSVEYDVPLLKKILLSNMRQTDY